MLLTVYGLFRTATVQTFISQKLAANYAKRLNTVVSIQGVDIEFFNALVLEGVYIEDLHQDTLLYLSKLAVGINNYDGNSNLIDLDEVIVNKGVIKIRKYEGEQDLNFKFILDEFKSSDTTKTAWIVTIGTTDLRELRFIYEDENRTPSSQLIDFKALEIDAINAYLVDTRLAGDSIMSKIESLTLKEKSGLVVNELDGDIKTSPRYLEAHNFSLRTPQSKVKGNLNFSHSGYGAYKYFIDSVRIQSEFTETRINLKDVSYFAKEFQGLNDSIAFNGAVRGTISKLKGKNIDLSYGSRTHFRGTLNLTGLPNFTETFISFRVKEFSTTQRDLAKFPVLPFGSGKTWNVPPYIRNLGDFKFVGDFTGFYNDFVAYGRCETALGTLKSDLSLSNDRSIQKVHYEGQVSSKSFDVGRLFDAHENLGRAAFDINIVGDGLNRNTAKAQLDGLIKGITLKDYYYQNVELKGELQNRRFNGYLEAKDENLDFVFNGEIDYSVVPPAFNFTSDIAGANLEKLNLAKDLKNPVFSVKLESNFSGTSIDDLNGQIHLKDLKYKDEKLKGKDEFYPVGDISLEVLEGEGARNLKFNSEFVDAKINGLFNLQGFVGALAETFYELLPNSEHLNRLKESTKSMARKQDFEYDILFKDGNRISSIFYPNLSISPETRLTGNYTSTVGKFDAKLISKEIKLGSSELKDVALTMKLIPEQDSAGNILPRVKLHTVANIGRFKQGKRVTLEEFNVSVDGKTNDLQFALSWDNDALPLSKGSVVGGVEFAIGEIENEMILELQPTEITLADTLWAISGNNRLRYGPSSLDVSGLKISNAVQMFKVDGSNSKTNDKGIDIVLSNFEIAAFESLIGNRKLKVDGIASGKATVYGLFSNPYATGTIAVKELMVNDKLLGDASFNSSWKAGGETVSLSGSIVKNKLETFSILASYYLKDAEEPKGTYKADIGFSKFRVNPFKPFVASIFAEISSSTSISGSLKLSGQGKEPVLLGKLNLQRGGFRMANLNTAYTFADEVVFTKKAIEFDKTVVNDMKGNKAIATGKVMHNYFKDWSLDLEIEADNVHSLNTDLELNSLYYGQAFATGKVHISGPFDEISIDVAVSTEKSTKLNIPLVTGEESDGTSYITFINGSADSTGMEEEETIITPVRYPEINMNIVATEFAEVNVIFDETVGDVLKANGNGDLQFKVDRDGNFNMYGTYTVRNGDYLFTLSGILNKRFEIEPGGTITWNGNPYEAILDINTIYSLNTSLHKLTGLESDKRRVRVDCHLKMSGPLMNPIVEFAIAFPDDEATSSDVQWMFNTEEEINKQVFSLLVLGQFQPAVQGEAKLSGGVGENPSELLSNQLSNWLSSISEDFDIGVNYRAGDELTEKELEVALSTQLFNDRLKIDGSVANNTDNTDSEAQNSSNIVGDFNLEYVLTKQGNVSLKAYNHATNTSLSTTTAPYRQGLGISYKKEFTSWRSLFGKMRKNKNEALIKE